MRRALWLLFALFIVYATTIPFQFDTDGAAARSRLSAVSWNPLVQASGRRISIPDAVQNVMLFMPFGVLGAMAIRQTFRTRGAVVIVATVAAASLSALVEGLQLFTLDRTSSSSDLVMNTLGGLAGALAADRALDWWFGWMREHGNARWMRNPWMFSALVTVCAIALFAWSPFDLTLDVSSVAGKVRAFLSDPWQAGPLTDEGIAVVLYALSALVFIAWFDALDIPNPRAAGGLLACTLAVGLELSQVFVSSRMPSGLDASVRLLGVALGAGLYAPVRRSRDVRGWLALLFLAITASACLSLLAPFAVVESRQPFSWFPFLGYYGSNWFVAISHVIDLVIMYFPLGFCLGLARPRRSALAVALLATIVAAVGVEYLQSWIAGRYADVTDVACSGLGGLIGAWVSVYGGEIFERSRQSSVVVI